MVNLELRMEVSGKTGMIIYQLFSGHMSVQL
jgi:hypothetical protein